jgi:hypothetical protein
LNKQLSDPKEIGAIFVFDDEEEGYIDFIQTSYKGANNFYRLNYGKNIFKENGFYDEVKTTTAQFSQQNLCKLFKIKPSDVDRIEFGWDSDTHEEFLREIREKNGIIEKAKHLKMLNNISFYTKKGKRIYTNKGTVEGND